MYQEYNARARILFCSSSLLLGDVLVAVAVVVCVRSLINNWKCLSSMYFWKTRTAMAKFWNLLLKLNAVGACFV